jgi:hypothetical protein
MYLSRANTSEDEDYFSYPVNNNQVLVDNAKVCLGGFSGSGPEYQMYKSNCMDLMANQCSSNWNDTCELYQSKLNKQEQDIFQQTLSFRQQTLPLNSYNSCSISSGIGGLAQVKGINPIVVGDTETILPLPCPFQVRNKENFREDRQVIPPRSYQSPNDIPTPQPFMPSFHRQTPQPFSPDRPVVSPVGPPVPFIPSQQSNRVYQHHVQQAPQPFSPDRPPVEPVGTPVPFIPSQAHQQAPQPTPLPFMPSSHQQAPQPTPLPFMPSSHQQAPQPFSPDRPAVEPVGTPVPFIPSQAHQQAPQPTPLPFMPSSHQQAPQPFSPDRPSVEPVGTPVPFIPSQAHQQAPQPTPLPFMPSLHQMQLPPVPHFAPTVHQAPQATVPPNPIVNVEPVEPVGTPIPFYPVPVEQRRVTFSDVDENINKLLNGEEEQCQTACSISKILSNQ